MPEEEPYELTPEQEVYAQSISLLSLAVIELTLQVQAIRDLLGQFGVASKEQIQAHIEAYTASHEAEMREKFIGLLKRPPAE